MNKVIVLASLIFSLNALALTEFPKGICKLDGFIFKSKESKSWIFDVNRGTNASTSFYLRNDGDLDGLLEEGQFRKVIIKIPQTTYSSYGEASLVNVVGHVNPYEETKLYLNSYDVKAVCQDYD